MGEENIKLSDYTFYIEGKEFGPTRIEPFECNVDEVCEEHRDEIFTVIDMNSEFTGEVTFTMIFNTEQFWKLTGLWDWVYQSCPNRRVRHLMKYGKTKRVREKNFKRALHIVGVILDE